MKLNRFMAGGILLLMLGVSQIDARKINFKVNKGDHHSRIYNNV